MKFYTVEKIARQLPEIQAAIHREVVPIPAFKYRAGSQPTAAAPDFDDSAWEDFAVGGTWGGYDQYAWFRARVPIPAHLRGHKLGLRFLVGPRDGGQSTAETLLYVNGEPLQGIDIWHETAWLPPELVEAGELAVALWAWSGVLGPPPHRTFRVA